MDLSFALAHWAQLTPDRVAVASPTSELTYRQLALAAQAFAGVLSHQRESRVGIYTTDPLTMSIGFHAALRAEKTMVILDPAWPEALLRSMSRRLGARQVITDRSRAPELENSGIEPLLIRATSDLPMVLPTELNRDREFLVICTSGSTGAPKATVRSQGSWEASIESGATILGAHPAIITLAPGPISHGLGLYALAETLHTGGTFLSPGRWNLAECRTLIQKYPCTRLVSVPTIIERICRAATPRELAHLTRIICGGERLESHVLQQIFSLASVRQCTEYYGSSEQGLIAYRHREPHERQEQSFVGTLFPGVSCHVHDDTADSPYGTLCVDSPFNATYYDDSGPEILTRCGTSVSIGETARQLPDARLMITGRVDGMLNVHGNNVHPQELRDAFAAAGLPGVRIVMSEVQRRQALRAYSCEPPVPPEKLRRTLRSLLPVYKIPHELVYLSDWPTTASGKISLDQPTLQTHTVIRKEVLR